MITQINVKPLGLSLYLFGFAEHLVAKPIVGGHRMQNHAPIGGQPVKTVNITIRRHG